MKKPSASKADVLNNAKKAKPGRANYTFRLPKDLIKRLDKVCKTEKVNRTRVLEELIRQFLDG